MPYLLAFCRLSIGFLFLYSFLTKVGGIDGFAQTITNFRLFPKEWSRQLALLFLMGELAVVVLLLPGGQLLPFAFSLALLLLATFTIALISVLARNIQTTCNCFGNSVKLLDYAEIGRNAGLILLAGTGLWVAGTTGDVYANPTFIEILFMAIITGTIVIVWANLNDIVSLFQRT